MALVVTLEWHQVGDVETGGWCDVCNLPSVCSVQLVLVNAATLHHVARTKFHVCTECGLQERTAE